jgi:hypothetical protein
MLLLERRSPRRVRCLKLDMAEARIGAFAPTLLPAFVAKYAAAETHARRLPRRAAVALQTPPDISSPKDVVSVGFQQRILNAT